MFAAIGSINKFAGPLLIAFDKIALKTWFGWYFAFRGHRRDADT
jgi:hypothetical protein